MNAWCNAATLILGATIVLALVILSSTEIFARSSRVSPISISTTSSTAPPNGPSGINNEAEKDQVLTGSSSTGAGVTTAATNSKRYKISMRFPETAVGGDVGINSVIDLRNRGGTYDAGFVCKLFEIDELRPKEHRGYDAHVVGIEPIVSEIEGYGSVIHHMDIFACQPTVIEEIGKLHGRVDESRWCRNDAYLYTSCRRLIWAYDRGAAAYNFPGKAGILLGPSSGFSHMVLQIHYLLPEKFTSELSKGKRVKPILDSSGFDLVLESSLRKYDAGIFGFLDISIDVPVGKDEYQFENHISSMELAKIVSSDLLAYKELHPFAVHLHAHEYATSITLTHYRGGKELSVYAQIAPFHGYGDDQTFIELPENAEPIKAGDSLTLTCVFNNTDVERPLRYGVSHGDEMCAPLVLYYPHAKGPSGYKVNNIFFSDGQMSPKDDASETEVLNLLRRGSHRKLRPRI